MIPSRRHEEVALDELSPQNSETGVGRSSTGLDTKIAAPLCYLLGVVSAVAFLVIEKEDREVRFHAYQSLATFGALFVVSAITGVIPLIGGLVAVLLTPLGLILWILLMLKAYQGAERFKLPVIGDWAEDQASV